MLLRSLSLLCFILPLYEAARRSEDMPWSTACLEEKVVKVACSANQKINLVSVQYGFDPVCSAPSKNNECLQISTPLTTAAKSICDGKVKCEVPIKQIGDDPRIQEEVNYDMGSCAVGGSYYESSPMTFMAVNYECKEFAFCKELNTAVSSLTIATEGYPEMTVTNPTCDCTFTADDVHATYIDGRAYCNGSLTFVTEEAVGEELVERRYFCNNYSQGGDDILIIGQKATSIKLTVDVSNSSEHSSYQIAFFSLQQTNGNRKPESKISVKCSAGSLFLPYTTKLILAITLPIGFIILIALLVLCCVCKKRRKDRKDWRRRNIRLPGENSTCPEPCAPTPAPSRNKQDQRVEPEGDDELDQFATLLARKNEERRQMELEKRAMYKQGVMTPIQRSPMITRRVHSTGNLRPERQPSQDEEEMLTPPRLAGMRSASQSRTSVRSSKKRPPPPPPPYDSAIPRDNFAMSAKRMPGSGTSHPESPLIYSQPYQKDNPYATPQLASPTDQDQATSNSDQEETHIIRPTRPPLDLHSTSTRPVPPPKPDLQRVFNGTLHGPPLKSIKLSSKDGTT